MSSGGSDPRDRPDHVEYERATQRLQDLAKSVKSDEKVTVGETRFVVKTDITNHEGSKYVRTIKPLPNRNQQPIQVDVYCVINAFGITCPALAHATKKLLCAGLRGKGDRKADLVGAIAAINRAVELSEET